MFRAMSASTGLLIALVLVTVFVQSDSKPHNKNVAELEEKLQENFVEQAMFKCGKPREKVFRVAELHKREGRNKSFQPHCVVLHRCGHDTGCCPEGLTCVAKPETIETVSKVFLVTDAFGFTYPKTMKFKNDTECHCVNPLDILSVTAEETHEFVAQTDSLVSGGTTRFSEFMYVIVLFNLLVSLYRE